MSDTGKPISISLGIWLCHGKRDAPTILRLLGDSCLRPQRVVTAYHDPKTRRERRPSVALSRKDWLSEVLEWRDYTRCCEFLCRPPRKGRSGAIFDWSADEDRRTGKGPAMDYLGVSLGCESMPEVQQCVALFRDLVTGIECEFGWLGEYHDKIKKSTGRGVAFAIPNYLPGLVAVNWLGPFLVDWIGMNRLKNVKEARIEFAPSGGVFVSTSESLLEADSERERRAEFEIAPDAFFDPDKGKYYSYRRPPWYEHLDGS